ncbi:MAG TPA: tryptophan 2,3-dioxygenase family protein [Solirubrobacteraceae bacterium]|nr:tryptophan 2,3-dioxygenase family protein [Solirubrobacteraceae bacterium]
MSESSVTYSSYLALDELLAAQRPASEQHDEMLFIVIHQVYELWFKQLLHEGRRLQDRFEAGDTSHVLHTAKRILTILKTIVAQVDVLETMTPSQFTSFRDRLDAASGFQSAQFRELEALMGRRDPVMLRPYAEGSAERARIERTMARPSLFDSLVKYLDTQGYPHVDGPQSAILAAYRDDGQPAQVCERMIDLDEGVMEWRYRHVQMVRRTIGDRMGTGGSSGARYLASTLLQPAFPDLWAVRTQL